MFDLVVLLLLANAVQNAMVGPDSSVSGGLVAAMTLLVLNGAVARLRLRSRRLRDLVEGSPTILVRHGRVIQANLDREGIDRDTLETAMREHGVAAIGDADLAVLEIDGSISVIPATTEGLHQRRFKFLKHG